MGRPIHAARRAVGRPPPFYARQVVSPVIDVPFRCPKCGGGLQMTYYVAPLRVLRKRTWYCCKKCGFEAQADEFKAELFCP